MTYNIGDCICGSQYTPRKRQSQNKTKQNDKFEITQYTSVHGNSTSFCFYFFAVDTHATDYRREQWMTTYFSFLLFLYVKSLVVLLKFVFVSFMLYYVNKMV